MRAAERARAQDAPAQAPLAGPLQTILDQQRWVQQGGTPAPAWQQPPPAASPARGWAQLQAAELPWKAAPIPAPRQLVLEQRLLQSVDPWRAQDPMTERLPLPVPPAAMPAVSQQMQFTVTTTTSVHFPSEAMPAALQAIGNMGMAHLAWQGMQGAAMAGGTQLRPRSISPGHDASSEVEDPWQAMAQPARADPRLQRPALPAPEEALSPAVQLALEDASAPSQAGPASTGDLAVGPTLWDTPASMSELAPAHVHPSPAVDSSWQADPHALPLGSSPAPHPLYAAARAEGAPPKAPPPALEESHARWPTTPLPAPPGPAVRGGGPQRGGPRQLARQLAADALRGQRPRAQREGGVIRCSSTRWKTGEKGQGEMTRKGHTKT